MNESIEALNRRYMRRRNRVRRITWAWQMYGGPEESKQRLDRLRQVAGDRYVEAENVLKVAVATSPGPRRHIHA